MVCGFIFVRTPLVSGSRTGPGAKPANQRVYRHAVAEPFCVVEEHTKLLVWACPAASRGCQQHGPLGKRSIETRGTFVDTPILEQSRSAVHCANSSFNWVGIGWSITKDGILMGHCWTLKLASRGPTKNLCESVR